MVGFDNINFEEYVEVLEKAVSNCDSQSRRMFLKYSFELLKKVFKIKEPVILKVFDSEKNPRAAGVFRITNNSCQILMSDKFLKTDKTIEMDGIVDFFTKINEMDNDWRVPLNILCSLCHEFKHCLDYFNNKLVAIDIPKLKNLSEEEVQAVYYLNSAERSARNFQFEFTKEVLKNLIPICKKFEYYDLIDYIEENMSLTLDKEIKNCKRIEEIMTKRLKDSKINIEDFEVLTPLVKNLTDCEFGAEI